MVQSQKSSSLPTGKKAPRVLIATLFLPETVVFDDVAASQSQRAPTPSYLDSNNANITGTHTNSILDSEEKLRSNSDSQIEFPSKGRSPHMMSYDGNHAAATPPPPHNGKAPLSPIHSGTSTPTRVATPPPLQPNAMPLPPPALSTTSASSTTAASSASGGSGGLNMAKTAISNSSSSTNNSTGGDDSDKENAPQGQLFTDRKTQSPAPTLSLANLPTLAALQAEDRLAGGGSKSGSRKPALNRTASILQDLQTKGTGLGAPTAPVTPGTTELELGANPFENTGLATASGVTAPVTPSLQSSIASARRPIPTRLGSDHGRETNLSPGITAGLRDRLERLNAARTPGSIVEKPQRSGRTPLGLAPGSGVSKTADHTTGMVGSYFSQTAGALSGATNSGSFRHRRRSSSTSTSRHSSMSGQEKPGLNRAFSRARKGDIRRRSSTSADNIVGPFSPTSPPAPSEPPSFAFEHNIHGNGGLQNAVRSVSDLKLRSASEPTRATFVNSTSGQTTSAQHTSQSSGAKAVMDEHVWIGTPGCSIADFDDCLRASVDQRYLEEKRSAVVWVEDDVLEPAYDLFCKQILWPTFHYQVLDAHKSKAYESPSWKDYKAMNQAFADRIVSIYKKGDVIWINDYHLLLVPQLVRQKLPDAVIGFFLHINFPSSEIFRCLPVRQELLEGVLGADLIGFQTYNLARHFRQTCQRLLSVEATPKGIQLANGFARVGVFSIGIDVKALNERKREREVADWLRTLRERYNGLKVLIARDKLDEIKGVRKKLQAYECFLEKYPHWQGKVVLIQVAMATSEENEKQGEVMDVVSRINARFSTFTYQPVVFLHQDVSFSQYLALLQVADCFINASLREGMNLTSHEFVICQEGHWAPLILSEFTGSYSKAGFHQSLAINPYDKRSFAEAINQALTMSENERISRWQDLERHVWGQTAQHWCSTFLSTLQRGALDSRALPHASPRMSGSSGLPRKFDVKKALPTYSASKKRLILCDLEGTLIADTHHLARQIRSHGNGQIEALLDGEMAEALDTLALQVTNTVYIMSGRPPAELDPLVRLHPRLGWIAENGCFVCLPERSGATSGMQRTWHKLVSGTHESWREPVLEILRYYTERTPGSVIDDRGLSIVWRYANTTDDVERYSKESLEESHHMAGASNPHEVPVYKDGVGNEAYHWARRQAAEVQNHVMDSLGERFGLQLYPGATSFLILPRKVGRAVAVAHILQFDDSPGEELGGGDESFEPEDEEDDMQPSEDHGDTAMDEEAEREPEADGTSKESARTGERLTSDVTKAVASRQLLEQYEYVLAVTGDQRLCGWLEEMALEKIVTVSVGNKHKGTRWRLPTTEDVKTVFKALVSD